MVVLLPCSIAFLLLFGVTRLLTYTAPVPVPPANSHFAPRNSIVSITYQQDIDATTVNSATFAIHAMQSGRGGAYSVSGGDIRFEPGTPFMPGEMVQVSATTGTLFLSGGRSVTPTVWQFRISPDGGSGVLEDSGLSNPVGATFDSALGDLDDDGDVDVVSTHSVDSSIIWINGGSALSKSLTLDTGVSESVALGDLDGDGDLDAFFGNSGGDQVWLNQGEGVLSDTTQLLGNNPTRDSALGDLDGDGDLDAVTANYDFFDRKNYIWLNDGRGNFSGSGQSLAGLGEAVSLGDVDNDGDLDLVFGQDALNSGSSTQIWLNDGRGSFTQGPGFGAATRTRGNALGDLNDDGLLDIITANFAGSDMTNRVWLNHPFGGFQRFWPDSGQHV